MMPASPPPIVHVAKKKASPSPTAVAPSGHHSSRSAKSLPIDDDKAIFHKSLQGKTFVQKIHAILEVPKYSSIISWNDAGDVVTIYDSDAFISEIVPLYFKKCKFGSFIRKMRRWGFSALTKKYSSTSDNRGQKSVIAFSSEHFLRDRPDLCLLMKDERHVKKQFSFLDHDVKNANHEENIQPGESSVGVDAPNSPSSSNVNAAATNYQTESNPDIPISPMVSPNQQYFHNPMQMMNMMMPTHHHLRAQQQLHYPLCDYGAPLPHGGVGFRPQSPMFYYPALDGYSSFPHHEEVSRLQHQQMMHQNEQHQQQNLLLQQQYLMMQQMNQHSAALLKRSPVSVKREAAKLRSPSNAANDKTSTAIAQSGDVAVSTSSSEETTELVPNTQSDKRSEIS